MDLSKVGYHEVIVLDSNTSLNLSERPMLRLFTLCILYLAQGIPNGFVSVTFASYLAAQGKPVEAIGSLMAWFVLPWTFKWIWGPFIDRFGIPAMGKRRPWILFSQLGMTVTLFSMACIPDPSNNLGMVGMLVFVHNIFGSLQDVSVDALAVDLLKEKERGKANGLMYGSKYLGMVIGGAFLSRLLDDGLTLVFTIQVLALALIMLFPLLLRERRGEKLLPWTNGKSQLNDSERFASNTFYLFKLLGRAFSLRATILTAIAGFTIFIGEAILGPITKVLFIQNLGWKRTEVTDIEGGYALILGLSCSILGGFLSDKFGPKRIASIGSIVLAAMYVVFGLASPESEANLFLYDWNDKTFVIIYILISTAMIAMISASMFSMCMTVSWPKVAGTQFTAYMAILNLSTSFGNKISGFLDIYMTLPAIFILAAALQIIAVLFFPLFDIHQTRRELGGNDSDKTNKQYSYYL